MNPMTVRRSLARNSVVVLARCLAVGAIVVLSGCGSPPREALQQYVARDAWDATCAEQAMVEKWSAKNARWAIDAQLWVVDVDATFKMANACTSGLPVVGQAYKQFQTIPFKKTVEMAKCTDAQGTSGWALPGRETTRCWTGPTLLQ
jgi:hypothetical protein